MLHVIPDFGLQIMCQRINLIEEAEVWLPIPAYRQKCLRGLQKYEISSYGRIRHRETGKIQEVAVTKGYRIFHGHRVGRLVGLAFLFGGEDGLLDIDHINEVKHDDRVSNLRWLTRQQNLTAGTVQKRRVATNKERGHRNGGREVFCVTTGETFPSIAAAARAYGLRVGNVYQVCAGINKTVKGYQFRYL